MTIGYAIALLRSAVFQVLIISAPHASCWYGCRSYYLHFSGDHFYSGTDSDICSQDSGNISYSCFFRAPAVWIHAGVHNRYYPSDTGDGVLKNYGIRRVY